jgi:aminopeptidase N
VTTGEFTALAERISGQDLDHFFQVWLYDEGRPTSW